MNGMPPDEAESTTRACVRVLAGIRAIGEFIRFDNLVIARGTVRDLEEIERRALQWLEHNLELGARLEKMEADLAAQWAERKRASQ